MENEDVLKNESKMTNGNVEKLFCKICGKETVQICKIVWINPNTYEIEDEWAEWINTYCGNCEECNLLIPENDFLEKNEEKKA